MVPARTAQMVPSTSISLSELSSFSSDLLKFFLPFAGRLLPCCGRGLLAFPPGRGPPFVLVLPEPDVCPAGRAVPLLAVRVCPERLLEPVDLVLLFAGRLPGREFCPPLGRLLGLGFGLIGFSLYG